MKKHIGTVYRHVRNNPGMFTLQDMVTRFNIKQRRMYDIFGVLNVIGVVIKRKGGCYTSAPQSVWSDSQWKRTLERIWGDSSEVQVVENNLPEVMCIDAIDIGSDTQIIQIESSECQLLYADNDGVISESYTLPACMCIDANDIGSDTQIIQIDSSECQFLYVDNDGVISEAYILETNSILEPVCLPVEWNGTQRDCTNGEVQCIDINNAFQGYKGILRDSHKSQVLCTDTEDLPLYTFDTQDILMNIPEGRVDWTNTDSLLESLLWLDKDSDSNPETVFGFQQEDCEQDSTCPTPKYITDVLHMTSLCL
jgi:hypothetical protein